jgi:uncharacterized protein YcnI
MKIVLALLSFSIFALAHVVVRPAESAPKLEQRYTMRVPTEREVATTSVQLDFPSDLTVLSVDKKADWTLELVRDAQGRIAKAIWRGLLPPKESTEFTFSARNPEAGTLEWRAIQTFADGSKTEWTGAEGTKTPASRTKIITKQ